MAPGDFVVLFSEPLIYLCFKTQSLYASLDGFFNQVLEKRREWSHFLEGRDNQLNTVMRNSSANMCPGERAILSLSGSSLK